MVSAPERTADARSATPWVVSLNRSARVSKANRRALSWRASSTRRTNERQVAGLAPSPRHACKRSCAAQEPHSLPLTSRECSRRSFLVYVLARLALPAAADAHILAARVPCIAARIEAGTLPVGPFAMVDWTARAKVRAERSRSSISCAPGASDRRASVVASGR